MMNPDPTTPETRAQSAEDLDFPFPHVSPEGRARLRFPPSPARGINPLALITPPRGPGMAMVDSLLVNPLLRQTIGQTRDDGVLLRPPNPLSSLNPTASACPTFREYVPPRYTYPILDICVGCGRRGNERLFRCLPSDITMGRRDDVGSHDCAPPRPTSELPREMQDTQPIASSRPAMRPTLPDVCYWCNKERSRQDYYDENGAYWEPSRIHNHN